MFYAQSTGAVISGRGSGCNDCSLLRHYSSAVIERVSESTTFPPFFLSSSKLQSTRTDGCLPYPPKHSMSVDRAQAKQGVGKVPKPFPAHPRGIATSQPSLPAFSSGRRYRATRHRTSTYQNGIYPQVIRSFSK